MSNLPSLGVNSAEMTEGMLGHVSTKPVLSNAWWHWPQRNQPWAILICSGTTLKHVLQAVQRVIQFMPTPVPWPKRKSKRQTTATGRQPVIKIQPSSLSATLNSSQGA